MRRILIVFLFAVGVLRAKSPAPPDPDWIKDVDYVGDGNAKHRLDLLLPKERTGKKLPLVVFIHGGSWSGGSRQDGMPVLRELVKAGYATATISYRLTDEAQWPAQIFDCKAAIRYLRAKAADYQIDPDHIGVAGVSAGGQLASMLGTSGGVKELEGTLGVNPKASSRVACVVDFFGPQDFMTVIPQNVAHPIVSAFGQHSVAKLLGAPIGKTPDLARQASPLTWVNQGDAPFLIAHGTSDPLVPFPQAQEIHTALLKAGVESHLFAMQGEGHGFSNDALNAQVMRFFNLHLKGVPAKIPVDLVIAKH